MRVQCQSGRWISALACSATLLAAASTALAGAPSGQTPADAGVAPDDMLTLVVGTHFVAPSAIEATAKVQFTDARIPLSAFNETDHCIDQSALEIAQEYFTGLGRVLGKAGHYYFVPDDRILEYVATCEKMHGRPPQAWTPNATKIIAFGKVVPTVDAPALEESIR